MSYYAALSDTQVLTQFKEALQSAYQDTSGTDDQRWNAVVNAALDDVLRSPLGLEALKRKRKWGDPQPQTPPGTMPQTVPIVNNDRLAIV